LIEKLASQCPDDSFAESVHPRGPRRGLQGLDTLGREDRVEGLAVLAVPVADQETQRLEAHAQVGGEVAGLLHGPLRRGVSGDAGDVQAARAVLEEDQRVDPTQVHQVNVQEIAGDDAVGLRCQELFSCRPVPAGSRTYACSVQDLPDRGRSDLMPQPCELALDPATPPARILSGQPQHQLFDRLPVGGRPGLLRRVL
jgi:hypothetical protein